MVILYKRILLFFFLLSSISAFSQSCTIIANNEVCLGNNIGFSVQNPSGTPLSYSWDFGDGSSSINVNPLHIFSKTGIFQVNLTIQYNDGSNCKASKSITVNALPKAQFFIDSLAKNICLYKNKICINDSSKPSVVGNPIVKRTFLWGDGGGKIDSNASVNNKIGCYTYNQIGTYKLLLEIADSKGCLSKDSQSISILPDVKSGFNVSYGVNPKNCKNEICFYNNSLMDSIYLKKHYWILNGKAPFSTDYDQFCITYDSAGVFNEKLVLENKNGCKDTFSLDVNIVPIEFKFDITLPKQVCMGSTVIFENLEDNSPAEYGWYYKDSAVPNNLDNLISIKNKASFTFGSPGKMYIKYVIKKDKCFQTYYDTIDVIGPIAKFDIFNNFQCTPKDSVIFCDKSLPGYKSYHIKREYNFAYGDSCFKDIKSGSNMNKNCNYSNEINAKHWYDFKNPSNTIDCFLPKLTLTDTVTGCSSEYFGTILLGKPTAKDLKLSYTVKEPCEDSTDGNPLRKYHFTLNNLKCLEYWNGNIIYDSAKKKVEEIKNGAISKSFSYFNTVDPEGYVTIGIVLVNGHKPFYKDCGIIDRTDSACQDTIWYHNFIRVLPEPKVGFDLKITKNCVPQNIEINFKDTIQYGLSSLFISYGDGDYDTVFFGPNDSIVPNFKHSYTKPGAYVPFVYMKNKADCAAGASELVKFGYNNLFRADTLICKGDSIEFADSIHYLNDTNNYFWRIKTRADKGLEKIWWDFDDGRGFVTEGSKPKYAFQDTGSFLVRMASKDSTGCRDTFTKAIRVVGFDVKIYINKDTFVCDDNIVKFYDSTVFPSFFMNDSVTLRIWDFDGDKRYLQNPFYDYNSYGLKRITLTLKTLSGCESTGEEYVFIKGPTPRFKIITDAVGCAPFNVKFSNRSGKASNFIWYSGDTSGITFSSDTIEDFSYTYKKPGKYYIKLVSTDSIFNPITGNTEFCADSTNEFEILVQRIPLVDFEIPERICSGLPFLIKSKADLKYTNHIYYVDFMDTFVTSNRVDQYLIKNTGTFDIWYKPKYIPTPPEIQCFDSAKKTIIISPIKANFTVNPHEPPYFKFNNTSIDGVKYKWDFGDYASKDNFSDEFSPTHNYSNHKGKFLACLVAFNYLDCPDTACAYLENWFEPKIFIPNVFTPGSKDTLNNRFDIDCMGELFYDLKIYNRWGELVFKTTTDGIGNTDLNNWDGTKFNEGNECPAGEYFVVLDYELNGYEPKTYKGTLTLIRE